MTDTLVFEYPIDTWFKDEPYSLIPTHMQEAITRYVVDRVAPGHFLQAVLKNDLRGAIDYADEANALLIKTYVKLFYNRAPSRCSGSPENYRNWLNASA
jgi:hypothetical protein